MGARSLYPGTSDFCIILNENSLKIVCSYRQRTIEKAAAPALADAIAIFAVVIQYARPRSQKYGASSGKRAPPILHIKRQKSETMPIWPLLVMYSALDAQTSTPNRIIEETIRSLEPTAKIENITPVEWGGFHEVVLKGHIIYVSSDGRYVIQGNVFDTHSGTDLTERRLTELHATKLGSISDSDEIIFRAKPERYSVTVFVDTECPYCRNLHQHVAEYNERGITIKYALYPLSIHKDASKQAEAVMCSSDRRKAFSLAMTGQILRSLRCANALPSLSEMASALGVSGTPAIFSNEGTLLGGYLSPTELEKRLTLPSHPLQKARP